MAKITPIFHVVDYRRNIAPVLILIRFLLIIGLGYIVYFLIQNMFFAAGVTTIFLIMISFIRINKLNIRYEHWSVERLSFFGLFRKKYSNTENPVIKIELSKKGATGDWADTEMFLLDVLSLILLFFYSEQTLRIVEDNKKVKINLNKYEFWLMSRISENNNTLVDIHEQDKHKKA